ncbi:Poly(3-hydroxyalkanoate) polymerase 1 [Modestobacter italicus]|uniref:Poly(3-hydroxyalkanoate) polymerase 1 n=1 Tax=Modestobacter italicus (strain DSM 44449 / CECT 9708 / BC 501) TaxID=2732864 RepID=I4F195_MODI5|nr:alpha/beta fold hydrolase [Modestobacter marinus]CCH89408.1 Poly(3-hydroxyalkanoate) polymerase 1 [Modestobacter marinus]
MSAAPQSREPAAKAVPAPSSATGGNPDSEPERVAEAATGLDMILTDAALGPLRRLLPPLSTSLRFTAALARHPRTVAGHTGHLVGEWGRIGLGRSEVAPGPKDKRYADPAWSGNGLLKRAMQAHLVAAETATKLVDDAQLPWAHDERVRFSVTNIVEALAPSNNPVLNPSALKAVIDTGGKSAVSGTRRLVRDLSSAPRIPSMVEPDAFEVGKDLARTPGVVVLRTPVFELIQYQPTTPTVHAVPLVMVPPTINKFYIADLAEGRSIVEHVVAGGQQVFMMSWRNPDARHADWGLDTYGQAVLDAMAAAERITGAEQINLMSFCSGGIITAMVLGHLAAIGEANRVSSVCYAVTVLDQARGGTAGAFLDEKSAQAATRASAKKGYLDGATLAEVFAWLRPNDLIWNYWVNNYLQGKPPPAFDILYWNADTTRMTAALHRGFLDMSVNNSLTKPGTATMLGTPVDLSAVTLDSYVVAGIADHICPWQSCYATTQLLGGDTRFVLSTSGHIASLVNPPTNPKSTWRTAPTDIADADEWLASAHTEKGSWWTDYARWVGERSGDEVDAPTELGGGEPTLGPAPGTYVFDK